MDIVGIAGFLPDEDTMEEHPELVLEEVLRIRTKKEYHSMVANHRLPIYEQSLYEGVIGKLYSRCIEYAIQDNDYDVFREGLASSLEVLGEVMSPDAVMGIIVEMHETYMITQHQLGKDEKQVAKKEQHMRNIQYALDILRRIGYETPGELAYLQKRQPRMQWILYKQTT
jgi:hypothetical protein